MSNIWPPVRMSRHQGTVLAQEGGCPMTIGREFEMTRTNVPHEFALVQRESQRVLTVLRDVMVELEARPRKRRHAAPPKLTPVPPGGSGLTNSSHSSHLR